MNSRNYESDMLMSDYPIMVSPRLAEAIGLNEAIFLQKLHYWCRNSGHFYDNHYWVYNTIDGWSDQFSFWSGRTIQRIITSLKKKKLCITTRKYNTTKTDRKYWYRIDYVNLSKISNLTQNDEDKMALSDDDKMALSDHDNLALSDHDKLALSDHDNLASCTIYTNNTTYNTYKEYNNKEDAQPLREPEQNSTPEHPVVVVSMIQHGISEYIALHVYQNHEADYIQQKIEYLESELRQNPNLRSPAGWLRRAIELDFSQPSSYQTEQRQEQRLEKIDIDMKQSQLEYDRIAQAKAKEEDEKTALENKRVTKASLHFGVTEQFITDWSEQILYAIEGHSGVIPGDAMKTVLLDVTDGHAKIGVTCDISLKRLSTRGKRILNSAVLFFVSNGNSKMTQKITHELVLVEEVPL